MITYRRPFKGEYPITQGYGESITSAFHTGIDYGCPMGTPILASAEGRVVYAAWDRTGYGNFVIVQHTACATCYAHLSDISVKVGQTVHQGELLGHSGTSGNSTGPHLHFEARDRNNQAFDPVKLPMMSADDTIGQTVSDRNQLKEADQLTDAVEIVAPAGAWGWSADFDKRQTVFPLGTKLIFTGKTTQRLGYTYCECYPEPVKYWVAVHNGTVQILDNRE